MDQLYPYIKIVKMMNLRGQVCHLSPVTIYHLIQVLPSIQLQQQRRSKKIREHMRRKEIIQGNAGVGAEGHRVDTGQTCRRNSSTLSTHRAEEST